MKTFILDRLFHLVARRQDGNTAFGLINLLLVLVLWPGSAFAQGNSANLLTTITNPTPAASDIFGGAVAAMGSNRVLIGAEGAAEAYLYSLDGTLLTTFTIPDPVAGSFGAALTAVGGDRVIIGGVWDNTGAPRAGSAYLFDLPYPPLSIAANATTVSVSWVTPETGMLLQETDLLNTAPVWSNTTELVSVNGLTNVVQPTITNGTTNRFFRLSRP